MKISICLRNINTNEIDTVYIEKPNNLRCFKYVDSYNCDCQMHIFDNELSFLRKSTDHELQLHFGKTNYAKIISNEGEISIDIKLVDFIVNDDIVVVRYIIENEEREIKIDYRS